jgi:hypothetical protein
MIIIIITLIHFTIYDLRLKPLHLPFTIYNLRLKLLGIKHRDREKHGGTQRASPGEEEETEIPVSSEGASYHSLGSANVVSAAPG